MIYYQYQVIKLLFEIVQKLFYCLNNLYKLVRPFNIANIKTIHHHINFGFNLDLNHSYQFFINYDSIKI